MSLAHRGTLDLLWLRGKTKKSKQNMNMIGIENEEKKEKKVWQTKLGLVLHTVKAASKLHSKI